MIRSAIQLLQKAYVGIDSVIVVGLAVLSVFLPLAFGGVQPWAVAVLSVSVVILMTLWMIKSVVSGEIVIRLTPLYIPILLFVFLVIAQTVPMPHKLLQVLSPKSFSLQQFVSSTIPATVCSYTISVDSGRTLTEISRFLCCAFVFFLTFNVVRSPRHVNLIIGTLLVSGFLIALFGIIQKYTWNGKLYWMLPLNPACGPFGSFANYDHFGGYINMVIASGFALTLIVRDMQKKVLTGFLVIVMAGALLLSRSRGALISFVAALGVMTLLFFIARKSLDIRQRTTFIAAIIALAGFVVLFIYWIDWGVFLGRIKTISLEQNFFDPRLQIWADARALVKEFPYTGTGYGTFSSVFPMYQHAYPNLFWRHAHNDYLQALIETGPVSLILALIFICLLYGMTIQRVIREAHPDLVVMLIGTSTAVATLLVHSCFDFNLRTLSNAFLFSMLAAIAASLASMKPSATGERNIRIKWSPITGSITTAIVCVVSTLFVALPALRAYAADRVVSAPAVDTVESIDHLRQAITMESNNSIYHYLLGKKLQEYAAGEALPLQRVSLLLFAKASLEEAIRISPCDGRYWASYAWVVMNQGDFNRSDAIMGHALRMTPYRKDIQTMNGAYRKLRHQGTLE